MLLLLKYCSVNTVCLAYSRNKNNTLVMILFNPAATLINFQLCFAATSEVLPAK